MVVITKEELSTLSTVLWKGEQVRLRITEHRKGGRILYPVRIYATDKRVIIVKRRMLGTNTINMIRYDHIAEAVIKNDLFSSKIHFGLLGENQGDEKKKWITGLSHKEALELVNLVHSIQEERSSGARK